MFRFIALCCVLPLIFLSACGDEKSNIRESQKEYIEAQQKRWEDYKTSIDGSYTMSYRLSNDLKSEGEEFVVVVSKGVLSNADEVTGDISMDVIFDQMISLTEDGSCELQFRMDGEEPYVAAYQVKCEDFSEKFELISLSE